jgi:2-polyprenyl-3-methyl-5-hydroxy-6-metoxy-1,4-benzoquinol methylase
MDARLRDHERPDGTVRGRAVRGSPSWPAPSLGGVTVNDQSVKTTIDNLSSQLCPACGSGNSVEVAGLDAQPKRTVLRCSACRLEFATPLSSGADSDQSAITSPIYIELMKGSYESSLTRINALVRRRLDLYTKLLGRPPQRILEVGAGTGWWVKAYQEAGLEAYGLELDLDLVRWASERLNLSLIPGDITACDLSQLGQFDIVYSSQTIEHILTPQIAITNMASALRPGGILHVDVPNADSWGSRVRRIFHGDGKWGVIKLPHHQLGYYPITIKSLLERAGLQVIQVSENASNDRVLGQFILPTSVRTRLARLATHFFGHGYLLVALARKSCNAS